MICDIQKVSALMGDDLSPVSEVAGKDLVPVCVIQDAIRATHEENVRSVMFRDILETIEYYVMNFPSLIGEPTALDLRALQERLEDITARP